MGFRNTGDEAFEDVKGNGAGHQSNDRQSSDTNAGRTGTSEDETAEVPPLQFANEAKPPRHSAYVAKHLLDRGQVSVPYGPTGCGKSFAWTHLGLAVARRIPVFGRRVIQSGCVFYFGSEGVVVKRLAAYMLHHELSADKRIPFVYDTRRFNLTSKADFIAVVALVKRAEAATGEDCVLAIFDTMARYFPSLDLDVPASMSTVARQLEVLRDTIGQPHVSCVHHTGHPGSTDRKIKLRGGYQLACDVDAVFGFSRDEETGLTVINVDKERDMEDGARLAFRLEKVEMGEDQDNDPITSCVVIEEDAPTAPANKQKKRTAAEHFADCVKDAMAVISEEHRVHNKRTGALIKAAVPYKTEAFKAFLYQRLFIRRDEPEGTQRSRLSRALTTAIDQRLIVGDETHLWWLP